MEVKNSYDTKVNAPPLALFALSGCFARDLVWELQPKGGEELSATGRNPF
jgi:hypothetical protein